MNAPGKTKYVWHTQSMAAGCPVFECPPLDPIKDFRRDPSGAYVLIRIDTAAAKIEAAVCDKRHTIVAVFRGSTAQDVYEGMFRYESRRKLAWFKSKGHMAYLGKELKKAELALTAGEDSYYQE